jgi:hypothetical protein
MGAAAAGGGAEVAAEIEPAAVPRYRQGGTGPPVLCIGACRKLPGYLDRPCLLVAPQVAPLSQQSRIGRFISAQRGTQVHTRGGSIL